MAPTLEVPWRWHGFGSLRDWARSLLSTPRLFARRAFYIRTTETPGLDGKAAGEQAQLARTLNWLSVTMLGVGMIIGAGVFVSTGAAAAELAGPAVILSFVVGGVSSLMSALVYAEFAAQYPIAGGAFNYISLSFGELAAWMVVTTLIMEYVLSQAAVARSFTFYFAKLIGKPTDFFLIPWRGYGVDFLAAGLSGGLTILLAFTTFGGATFNLVITLTQLVIIVLILILGFIKANPKNLTPFLPYGVRGIFDGASFVFFSFIGFDAVSTLAEETKNPAVDMPVGIVGCILIATIVYVAMAVCICLMVPYQLIDKGASFATAMVQAGFPWASYIVALGACLGIVTGVLANIMGVSRILCSLARTHLAPPVLGKVSRRFLTPLNATLMLGVAVLPLAILSDLPALIEMVSAGTLAVFAVVALALIWHRYVDPKAPAKDNIKPAISLATLTLTGIAFACVWGLIKEGTPLIVGLSVTGGIGVLCAVFMHVTCRTRYKPVYASPLFPYTPVASYMLNCFLMASLKADAYIQLAAFFGVMLAFYILYSIHSAQFHDNFLGIGPKGTKATDLEDAPTPDRKSVV